MSAILKNVGLAWKVQLAPAFLILILIGLGVYSLQNLQANQASVDALVAGPLKQAELAGELNTIVWTAHARLYRLAATAANESDQKKIQQVAKEVSASTAKIMEALKAIEDSQSSDNNQLKELRTAATGYIKQAGNAIEMADSDAGTVLVFIKGAERNFATIEKLTDNLILGSNESKDREIARAAIALERQQLLLSAIVLVVALFGAAISFAIGRGISRPVMAMSAAMHELATGHFDVQLPGLERKDEVGQMARAVDEFKMQAIAKAEQETAERERKNQELAIARRNELQSLADTFETAVGEIIEKVTSASKELENSAIVLTQSTENTRELSALVTTASAETSENVQSVASAAEEMASSVHEIGHQVQNSSMITREAVDQAQQTDARITKLSHAATRIGDVTKLITTIAEQTNLLALNATIEAARAGDAGRGFAVVAQEVKMLAEQTAKATHEISTQIAEIQAATQDSVIAIKEISGTIGRVSEISTAIAAAVEEQGAATQEISRNVQQAALGTTQVASNIAGVNKGASDSGIASSQVLSSAQLLSIESTRLKQEMDKFLTTVRAA
jgi:methyl-accepting chemotaxis protein